MPPEINPPIENGINALSLNEKHLERTSDWSIEKMDSFKLVIRCGTWASRFEASVPINKDPSDVYSPACNLICSKSIYTEASEKLKASQKPFYNRLNRLRKRPDCPGVVYIAHDLLTHTGFEDGPIHFIPQAKLETKIGTMTFVSDADYVVIGQFPSLVYMVVIEDTCGSETFEQRRYQMAGDMLVAATIRYTFISQHGCCAATTRIFGMLVWKTNVSFYQATFSHAALTERQSGCPTPVSNKYIDEHLAYRLYCPNNAMLLLLHQDDRRSIVSILLGIKKEISSLMSDV
jgi:hypothetical protein